MHQTMDEVDFWNICPEKGVLDILGFTLKKEEKDKITSTAFLCHIPLTYVAWETLLPLLPQNLLDHDNE